MTFNTKVNDAVTKKLIQDLQDVMIAEEVNYPEAFAACVFLAVHASEQLMMSKDSFLLNCSNMYDVQIPPMRHDEGLH